MGFQTIALVLMIGGLYAAFESHWRNNRKILCTLHSWIGVIVCSLFTLQWVGGTLGFLFPPKDAKVYQENMKVHRFMGFFVYLASTFTVK